LQYLNAAALFCVPALIIKTKEYYRMKFSSFVLSLTMVLVLAFAVACTANSTTPLPLATTAPTVTANSAAPTNAPAATVTSPSNSDAGETPMPVEPFTKINLNTATAEQILTIPNTGNRMVREFQEYRPYTSILQFRREIGKYVDQATVSGYEEYVYVPVDINQSDAATLQQLPGVSTEIAAQLIAARPYADRDAFLEQLSALAPGLDTVFVQNYLVP
jgi:DNA uptake protein ComE-like DNA-binding protein